MPTLRARCYFTDEVPEVTYLQPPCQFHIQLDRLFVVDVERHLSDGDPDDMKVWTPTIADFRKVLATVKGMNAGAASARPKTKPKRWTSKEPPP